MTMIYLAFVLGILIGIPVGLVCFAGRFVFWLNDAKPGEHAVTVRAVTSRIARER